MKRICALMSLLALSTVSVQAQTTKINPVTQVNWPPTTGIGAPAAACTSVNYGQPYTDLAANRSYVCVVSGWALVSGGGGSAPAPPANCIQLANTAATALACDPEFAENPSTHTVTLGSGSVVTPCTLSSPPCTTIDSTGVHTSESVLSSVANGTYNTAQYASGSNTGGLAEAYAACINAGATVCDIQISSDFTISSTQTISMSEPVVPVRIHGVHNLSCSNPTGKCLIFSGVSAPYGSLQIDGLTVDGTSSGGSGIELINTQASQINMTINHFSAQGILAYAQYISGSVTGASGAVCPVTGFNNISGASATVTLPSANTINVDQPLTITNQGSGATSAPTTATLGSPCSGSINVYSSVSALAFEANDVEDTTNGPGISLLLFADAQGALFDNSSNNLEVKLIVEGGVGALGHALDTEGSSGIAYRGLIQSSPTTLTEVIGGDVQGIEHDNLWYEQNGDGTSNHVLIYYATTSSPLRIAETTGFSNSRLTAASGGLGSVFGSSYAVGANTILSSNNQIRSYPNFVTSAFSGLTPFLGFGDYNFISGATAYYQIVCQSTGCTMPAATVSVNNIQTTGSSINTLSYGLLASGGVGVESGGSQGFNLMYPNSTTIDWRMWDSGGIFYIWDAVDGNPAFQCSKGSPGYCQMVTYGFFAPSITDTGLISAHVVGTDVNGKLTSVTNVPTASGTPTVNAGVCWKTASVLGTCTAGTWPNCTTCN